MPTTAEAAYRARLDARLSAQNDAYDKIVAAAKAAAADDAAMRVVEQDFVAGAVPSAQRVNDYIRAWVASGSGLDTKLVVPGYEDGPAPREPHATVVSIDRDISRVIYREAPPIDVWAEVEERVSVQWFRSGANRRASLFAAWCTTPQAAEQAARMGLLYMGSTPVRDASELVGESWEERAGMDVQLGYAIRPDRGLPDRFVEAVPFATVSVDRARSDAGTIRR